MDTVSTRTGDSSSLSISTIGEDLAITGNVTSKGELQLNGQIRGDIDCKALVVGENARLEGNVVAEDVTIRGRLIGSVRALRLTLQSTSHVAGNLYHRHLSLEQGTHFEGESHPLEDPLSFAPEAQASKPQSNQNVHSDAVKKREPAKGFLKSLPESRSA